jgi:hypothetical protein
MRSLEDIIDCEEDNSVNSYFQVGNDMILTEDFINFQVGRNGPGGQWKEISGRSRIPQEE